MKWQYGVTTIPERADSLLPRALESLKKAGFGNPWIFVDGDDNPAEWKLKYGPRVTMRYPSVKLAGNWILSLWELFLRDPSAERYAIFQDDFVTYSNLRQYLDRCKYPDGPPNPNNSQPAGYWNLYTAPSNQDLADATQAKGWFQSHQHGRGALALVFSREAVITLLSSRHLVDRCCDPHRGWRSIDGGIMESFRIAGWKEYVHNPSLVLHTGTVSSIDKRKGSTGDDKKFPDYEWPDYYNRTSFRGEDFDALELLKEATHVRR